MAGICDGRVVIVTGAGRGIGREHALAFAREGAKVVVNDLGATTEGEGADASPAQQVVAEIRAMGGEAVVNGDDVSDWDGAQRLVQAALDAFGDLHVLVNNAGILRDRMFVNMSPEEWDAVIAVHLRGSFAPTRHAVTYWRARAKEGHPVDGRVINTSSPSGLFGNVGQANYGAAKAALAAFTVILADELGRLGVTVNAIAPVALTRMTEGLPGMAEAARAAEEATGFNPLDPANISPLVVWLGSPQSAGVTGRVFTVSGGEIGVAETWVKGPVATKQGRWQPAELTDVVPGLVERARGNSDMFGNTRAPGAQGTLTPPQ
jgi:NAD(P)-dependent dehydrogenase (short-subunit alcohol dehydrogenase family)